MNRYTVFVLCAFLTFSGAAMAQVFDFETTVPTFSSGANTGTYTAAISSEAPLQSGNHLKFTHVNAAGFPVSAASATVIAVDPNSTYQISCWMRVSNPALVYWAELGWKLGNQTALNFNDAVGTWTLVTKFPDNSQDDNVWHHYTSTVTDTGSNTELTIGFKLGAGGSSTTVMRIDSLEIVKSNDPPTAVITTAPTGTVSGNVAIPYTLTDGDDLDADASIVAEYAVRDEFTSSTLDIGVQWNTLGGSLITDLSTPGTLRVNGAATDKSFNNGSITASVLSHTAFGSGNFSIVLAITGITNDPAASNEGVGIAIVTPNFSGDNWFTATLKYDAATSDLRVAFNSSVNGGAGSAASTAIASAPTPGQPFLLRVERIGNGYRTRYDADGAGFTALGSDALFPSGNPLASGSIVRAGITASTPGGASGFSADIDYLMSGFRTATEGPGSDGLTGLASTSGGNAHTFVWNTSADIPIQLDGVVFRITPSDDDGTGTAATTGVFAVDNFDTTNVARWNVYR